MHRPFWPIWAIQQFHISAFYADVQNPFADNNTNHHKGRLQPESDSNNRLLRKARPLHEMPYDLEKEFIMQKTDVSRRRFLTGLATAAAGATAAGLMGCKGEAAPAPEPEPETPAWMPQTWDYETDIAIIGYGGAGASAAITAKLENLGDILVLEAAPEGLEGGNTRASMQAIFCPESVEGALLYQKTLNGDYVVDDEMMQAWAEELCKNEQWLQSINADPVSITNYCPEFPGLPGAESCRVYAVEGKLGGQRLWKRLKEKEAELGYQVLYDTRAVRLVRNPLTNEALGVYASQEGKDIVIKARKGIVLAQGGFEWNEEMIRGYYEVGVPKIYPMGTPYNRGDGFKLIQPFGAELWHMNATAGTRWVGFPCGKESGMGAISMSLKAKDYIYVGPEAKRFMYEETGSLVRHGKINTNGVWATFFTPTPTYCIFGQKCFDAATIFPNQSTVGWDAVTKAYLAADNEGYIKAGVIKKAETIAELAKLTGFDEAALTETINKYNADAVKGVDTEFNRGTSVLDNFAGIGGVGSGASGEMSEVIAAFDLVPIEAPYYITEIGCGILNTQGGPKRLPDGGLQDGDGNRIPRLYAAGEFGCIYGYMYNGGGNVSDALSSGRIAVRSASKLEPWDAVPASE